MSGFSSQGVGAVASASAAVASTPSAATVKNVFAEKFVIANLPIPKVFLSQRPVPSQRPLRAGCLNKSRTLPRRQYDLGFPRVSRRADDFVISRVCLRDYLAPCAQNEFHKKQVGGDSHEPRHENWLGCRIVAGDAGFLRPRRRVPAQQQPAHL